MCTLDGHLSVGQVQLVGSIFSRRLGVGKVDNSNLVDKQQNIGEADSSANQLSNDWLQFDIIIHHEYGVRRSGSSNIIPDDNSFHELAAEY